MATRRASSGYPGVQVRPDGSVRIRVRYRGEWCYERTEFPPTDAGKRQASRLRREVNEQSRVGGIVWRDYFPNSPRAEPEPVAEDEAVFETVAHRYLAHCVATMSPSTVKGYTKKISIWCDAFRGMPIASIRRSHVSEVVVHMGWSGKTLSNSMTPLRGVFDFAIDDELIARNPAMRIKSPSSQRPPPDPLTSAEVEAVLEACERTQLQWLPFWRVALGTGMRTSELIGLQWDSVDLTAGTVRVFEKRVENTQIETTKSRRERVIPCTGMAMRGLREQRPATQAAGGHVFLHPSTGKPIRDDQAPRRSWNAMLAAAGVRHRKAYSSRCTFACLHIAAHVDITRVSEWLGHSTPRVTWEYYAAWLPGDGPDNDTTRVEVLR